MCVLTCCLLPYLADHALLLLQVQRESWQRVNLKFHVPAAGLHFLQVCSPCVQLAWRICTYPTAGNMHFRLLDRLRRTLYVKAEGALEQAICIAAMLLSSRAQVSKPKVDKEGLVEAQRKPSDDNEAVEGSDGEVDETADGDLTVSTLTYLSCPY